MLLIPYSGASFIKMYVRVFQLFIIWKFLPKTVDELQIYNLNFNVVIQEFSGMQKLRCHVMAFYLRPENEATETWKF